MHGRLRAATRRRGRSTASRPTSTASSWRPTGRASGRSWRARSGACRRWPTPASTGSSTARRGSPRTTSSSSASPRSRGFFVAAGFCAHGIAGAGGIGRQMATWIVDGEPELDLWKMDIRRFGPAYRSQAYTLARSIENYATYYDIHYPNEERQAGRPLRTSPTYDVLRGPRRGLRREVRLGAAELVRVERRRRRRGAPPARLGGDALVAGHRRRGARHPAGGRAVRRDLVRQARGRRAGRRRLPRARCARTTIDVPVGTIVYTQLLEPARRDRVRPDRHPGRRRPLPAGHRHRVRAARPGLAAAPPARRRERPAQRPDLGPGLLRAVGAARPRHPRAAHARRRSATTASRT